MSESNKFTPGPWSLDESRHAGCINRLDPFRHIAMVSAYQATKEDKEENRANALLISAAPDLLEALKNLENDDGQIPDHAWTLCQDAIRAAEGEMK